MLFDFGGAFEFAQRPRPIPGDLRVVWRISALLVGISKCRGQRASYYKIHVINDLFANPKSVDKLRRILNREASALEWRTRIEPALNRATDYLVGEKFAYWTEASSRATIVLTADGVAAAKVINDTADTLEMEKKIATEFGTKLTEAFVRSLYFNRYEIK